MKQTTKLQGAAALLVDALGQQSTALSLIVAAVNAAVLEGQQGDGSLKEQRENLILWCKEQAEQTGFSDEFSTLRTYIANAASIALVPDASASVETGPKGKKSIRTITAENAVTRRDVQALAEAAGKKIGVVQRGKTGAKQVNSGAAVAAPMDQPKPDTRTPEEIKQNAFRILAEQAEEKEKQFVAMLLDAVSGKNDHLRRVADNVLRGVGMRLAAIVAAKPVEDVAPVLTNPVIKVAPKRNAKTAQANK